MVKSQEDDMSVRGAKQIVYEKCIKTITKRKEHLKKEINNGIAVPLRSQPIRVSYIGRGIESIAFEDLH